MKTILITGSNGFIGRVLKERLLKVGYEVIETDSSQDITMTESFLSFECRKIDHVFHLAGKTFVPESWSAPASFYRVNVNGTVNVIDFCRRHGISLTYVSAYIYGQPQRLPICEDHPVMPNNPYAHSKFLAEEVCKFYSDQFGMSVVILRPFNVYGPGHGEKFLIPLIIKQALEGNEIRVKELTSRRDWVYIDDLVDALVLSMKQSGGLKVYNIGYGRSVNVKEVIDTIQKIIGSAKPVVSENVQRKNEIDDTVADISHAAEGLNWHPKTSFEEGIKKTIESYRGEGRNIPINKGNYSMEPAEREELFEKYRGESWDGEYRDYRKNWSEFAKNKTVSEYPLLVDAELASMCNLKCPMCYTITDEFKEKINVRLMDFELFKRIINEISGNVPALRLSLRGEPTLHSKFVECIKYAKDNGIKEVSFLTNGSKLTAEFFEKIMEAGADWITISVDGVDNVYESIRKPLKFKETQQKVIGIKEIKSRHNSHKPVIKIQSIWPAIRGNPEEYYNTFKPYVDLIAFNPLIDYLGKDTDIVYEDNFSCPQHYQRLVIGADGLVMMCSNDEEGTVIVGDANRESVYEIWHGEKLNRMREQHKKRNGFMEIPVCKKCYLPRATEDGEKAVVNGREFIVKNYVNRRQEIGG